MMHKAWSSKEELPNCFSRPSNFKVTWLEKNGRFWPKLGVSRLELKFEFTDGFEMMQKAWCSIENMPYYFPGSSIKCQGHAGWKIDDVNPIWRITGPGAAIKSLRFALFFYFLLQIYLLDFELRKICNKCEFGGFLAISSKRVSYGTRKLVQAKN